MLLMDVSGSMNEMKRLERAKESASRYLASEAPDCTLAIVAPFGVTADVRGAEFLTSPENRLRLVDLVQHLTAVHPHTNLDEAAKLVELLSLQLQSVHGARLAGLSVRVYSDLISAPSIGKSRFSLADYLVDGLAARYTVTTDSFPDEQHIQVGLSASLIGGQPRKVAVGGARRLIPMWALPFVAAAVLLALGLALLAWRLRSSRPPLRNGGVEGLLVTESAVQVGSETPEVFARGRGVPVTPGVPAVFSPIRAPLRYRGGGSRRRKRRTVPG